MELYAAAADGITCEDPPMSPAFMRSSAGSHGWLIATGGLLAVAAVVLWMRFSLSATMPIQPLTSPTIRPAGATLPAARNASPLIQAGFDDAELTEPLARALATVSFKRRAHRFERLGASLTADDLENAFRTLARLDIAADREAFIRGIFGALARGDKIKAMLAARRLTDKSEEDIALMALVDVWVEPNINYYRHAERSKSDNPAAGFGRAFLDYNNSQPELLALWARTLTQGKDRADLLTLAASREYWANPTLAESYGAELTGSERAAFDFEMLRVKPFDLAWHEGSALADSKARTEAQIMLLEQTSEAGEPNLAAEHLAELPQEQHTNELFSYVAGCYGMMDNAGAWKWLDTLSGEDADLARVYITMYTPSDLGVTFVIDSEGYPVIAAIRTGDAAEASSLRVGDRVLAVNQHQLYDDALVDVQGASLAEVNKLAQGTGNEPARVRVARVLPGGGYSTPVVVQITRHLVKPSL